MVAWIRNNQTLAVFLAAQLIAVAVGGVALVSTLARLEQRVETLESRVDRVVEQYLRDRNPR